MPLLNELGAGLGGFAEGMLAGRKLGLEQEALDLRSDDLSSINTLRDAEVDRLEAATKRDMEELKSLEERRIKKETPITNLDERLQKQFPVSSPNQLKLLKSWYSVTKPLNDLGSTNEADFEDFIREMSDDPTTDYPRLRELAKIGVEDMDKTIGGFKGDLKKIQDRQAKKGKPGELLTTKELAEIDTLESNIKALEEVKSFNMQLYNTFSHAEKTKLPTTQAQFFILTAFQNAARNNTTPEDEYMLLLGKADEAELSPMEELMLGQIQALKSEGFGNIPSGNANISNATNPFEFEPPKP